MSDMLEWRNGRWSPAAAAASAARPRNAPPAKGRAVAVVDRARRQRRGDGRADPRRGGRAALSVRRRRRRRGRGHRRRGRHATSGASPASSPRPASSTAPTCDPRTRSTVDDFLHVLRVNLVGTFAVIKYALPMLVDGGGAIVTIASTAAIRGHGYGAGYTASKGGVDALTRLLAVQYGPQGVRANCICPGGVDTPMTGGTFATDEAQRTREATRSASVVTRNRKTSATSRCSCSQRRCALLTGQTVPVEGGATIA